MKKITLAIGLHLCAVLSAYSQEVYQPFATKKVDKVESLFSANADDLSYNFTLIISKELKLNVAFSKASLWQGSDAFRSSLSVAEQQLKLYADSLKSFANSRRLDVHIPEKGEPIITRLSNSITNNNLRVQKDGQLDALKMEKDTLRMVQFYDCNNCKQGARAPKTQFIFIVKSLNDLGSSLQDKEWVATTVHLVDSIMNVYKAKWRNPDAEYHNLFVRYNPDNVDQPIRVSKRPIGENRVGGLLLTETGLGVSLVRNTICPSVNFGLKLRLPSTEKESIFFKVSLNSFLRYEEQADKRFKTYTTSFINAEFGIEQYNVGHSQSNLLLSMGFGYKLPTQDQFYRDPSMDENMYKLFFNYGLSKSIILQPEFISNFRKKEKGNGWVGISINFQLF
jgi:hypothetical protein